MHPLSFYFYCDLLGSASILNIVGRDYKKVDRSSRFARILNNTIQATATAIILKTALGFLSKQIPATYRFPYTVSIAPAAIALTTSGLAYLANRFKYSDQKMDTIERNFGDTLDLINRASLVAFMIILAPFASRGIAIFGLTSALVTLDFGAYYFISKRSTKTAT